MKLLLVGRLDDAERDVWLAALREALPDDELLLSRDGVDAAQIEVALAANPPPGALAGLPTLRLIQSLWAGVDRLLADDTLPRDVPIARMVDPAMTQAMVQTVLWAVLSLHRGFFGYQAQQRAGQWRPHAQRRAEEVGVAVLGCGEMGRAAAAALAAQGYRVAAWSRTPATHAMAGVAHAHGREALGPLLSRCAIVVNLLPLTPDTRGLLDAACLARLPRGAGVVNFARGAHVVDADLLAALDSGQVGHAVLDVFHREPLPAEHRYWTHPAVTLLPHVAAQTDARSAAQVAARNIAALKAGAPLAHRVDRQRGY
jgi:glyoxylate/hydroxypyruvate reductase A